MDEKRNQRSRRRLFFLDIIGWSNTEDITNGSEKVADGTFLLGHQNEQIPDFEKYFQSLRFNNYDRSYNKWIGEYWQIDVQNGSVATSYTAKCSGDEPNTNYKDFSAVHVVINAVQAMANALDNLQRHFCLGTLKICKKMRPLNRNLLLEFLKNITFEDAAIHFPVKFYTNQEVDGNYSLFNFRKKPDSFVYFHVGSWVGK